MYDPIEFPNIYFGKTKAQHNFCSLRFKVSIHKVFHQHLYQYLNLSMLHFQ